MRPRFVWDPGDIFIVGTLDWDPGQHPRNPKGDVHGGEFVSGEGGHPKKFISETSKLSAEQLNALGMYKINSYAIINKVAAGRSQPEDWKNVGPAWQGQVHNFVKLIDSAFDQSKLNRNMELSRYVDSKEFKDNASKFVGKDLPSYGYTSTTTGDASKLGRTTNDKTVIKLRVTKGSSAINMERRFGSGFGRTSNYHETEILLPRTGRIHVDSYDAATNTLHGSWHE